MLTALADLNTRDHEIILLRHALDTLRWDQETGLPPRGIAERSEQIALLEGLIHDKITDPRQGELFAAIGMSEKTRLGPPGLSDETRAFLREAYRRYTKSIK
ncbi:MAG TPA: carboxypeptidase M32, partial [Spirochaetia bacterium]|nr:carboxypeptidase M32 [Spirochaetia bacterium]